MTNFQRVGAISNAHVGRDFENLALEVLTQSGVLQREFGPRGE